MDRFVRPQLTRLTLPNGDWLDVNTRLTAGQLRGAYTRMYLAGADGRRHVDPLAIGTAMILAYLVDWSVRDLEGQPVPIRDEPTTILLAALDDMTPEFFDAIKEAVDTHDTVQAKARADEKKILNGAPLSAEISASLGP